MNNSQLPEGYKLTGVGLVPEDWEVVRLGEHARFRTGPFGSTLHKSDYTLDGVPVINPMHIVDGQLNPTRTMTITESAANNLSDFRLKAGDIVIGRRGDMGRCAVVQPEHSGWLCGTGSMIVRCDNNTDAGFLQRVLSSPNAIAEIEEASVGTTMVNLNQSTLSELLVQFPPLPEQRSIATALSDMDELLGGLDRLIAKKRDLKQSTMQQLLTGKMRLPGFCEGKGYKQTEDGLMPEDWDLLELGKFAEVTKLAGFEYTNYFNSYRDSGEIIVVRGVNITHNVLDFTDVKTIPRDTSNKLPRSQLKKGDLVFAYVGTIGPIYLIEESDKYHLGPNTARITCKDGLIPDFLLIYFTSSLLRKEIDGKISVGAQPSLSMTKIRSFKILKPPLPEQKAIASILSDMDTEIAAIEQRRNKTRDLKQAMMQELLTGRIRLKIEA